MDQQSFIYKFLLVPQFRVWRYIALVVFFIVISTNQVLFGYEQFFPLMGNDAYWIILGLVVMYLISVYLILKIILKYSASGRYLRLILSVILCSLFFTIVTSIPFIQYEENYNFLSASQLIDNLSAFVVYILCVSGVIIPVFLKNWVEVNLHLNQLKIKHASSQVEQFKEQINPPSFFKILSSSKNMVKIEPDKASEMLLKLSQLLRYQLYDCNREQVLLNGELSFLKNFLELEKLHSSKFNYTITVEGNINGVLVSPLILLPYLQGVVNAFDVEKESHIIDVRLGFANEIVYLDLSISGFSNDLLNKELKEIRTRLNTLYRDRYKLMLSEGLTGEKTEVTLQLDKE